MSEYDYEMSKALSEFFARFVRCNFTDAASFLNASTGINEHTLPMDSSEACEWYRKRLGLNDNTDAKNGREDA